MNDKIYIGFTLEQLDLILNLLEYRIEENNNFEDENEDFNSFLEDTIKTILKEVN